jgi:hypothetical protein
MASFYHSMLKNLKVIPIYFVINHGVCSIENNSVYSSLDDALSKEHITPMPRLPIKDKIFENKNLEEISESLSPSLKELIPGLKTTVVSYYVVKIPENQINIRDKQDLSKYIVGKAIAQAYGISTLIGLPAYS